MLIVLNENAKTLTLAAKLLISRNLVWYMYLLQNLQRHPSGIHFLIFSLKLLSKSNYLISSGTRYQIFGPRYEKV